MKTPLRFLALIASALVGFNARGQTMYDNTADSASTYGSGLAVGNTAIQTFALSAPGSIQSMSWLVTNFSGVDATATFQASIYLWGVDSSLTIPAVTDPVTFIPVGMVTSGGTTLLNFSFSGTILSPNVTYAVALSATGAGNPESFATLVTDADSSGDFFSSGAAFFYDGGTTTMSLANPLGGDWAMTATVVPEPKAAAAGIAALFVAALVGRQMWLRRKLQPVPVAV